MYVCVLCACMCYNIYIHMCVVCCMCVLESLYACVCVCVCACMPLVIGATVVVNITHNTIVLINCQALVIADKGEEKC